MPRVRPRKENTDLHARTLESQHLNLGKLHYVFCDDEPYFLASDVLHFLGFINDEEAIRKYCPWSAPRDIYFADGSHARLTIIPSDDVYQLIEHAPDAVMRTKFCFWFTDVLNDLAETMGRRLFL